jgi:S1-C subfamily serine protease
MSLTLTNQDFLTWGNAREASTGDAVFVLGDPSGFDQQSISKGVIRDNTFMLAVTVEALIFDASVLGGNSGGPFVDVNGNVLGITTFSYSSSDTFVGGVSQHIAEPVSNTIIQTQADYVKGYLGWYVLPIRLSTKAYFRDTYPPGDVTPNMDGQVLWILRTPGVLDVPEDSPLTTIDGTAINVVSNSIKEQITNITWFKSPGETVTVTYRDPTDSFTTKTAVITLLPFPVGYEIPLDNYAKTPAVNVNLLMPVNVTP